MKILEKTSNQVKKLKLQRRKKNFNNPGDGGSVAYLLATNYGEPVLVFHNEDREGSILNYYLESVHFGRIERSEMILILKKHSLFISDIRVLETEKKLFTRKYRKGYGSVLMSFIEKEAKQRGYKQITGEMKFNDEENKKRQINFYTKHCFEINSDFQLSKKVGS